MNRLKLLAAVALLGIPLAACEETTPPPPVGSIVGQVSIEGTGIDGVSVNLSNGNTTSTAGGGNFRFDNVEGGAYTITISGYPSDATFDATSAAATIASAGQSVTVNFTGSFIRTASVMGTVTVENMGLGGVTVALSGVSSASTVTDGSGQYAFTGLRMGGYSVEISGFDNDEIGFSNIASSVTVGTGESKIISFDGTYLRTAGIQGQVSVEGVGLEGVNVSVTGGPDGEDMSTMTDAAGLYSFSKLRAGDYAVGISGYDTDEYEFTVTSQNVTVALGETANIPFAGILLRTSGVAGRVSVGGMGIADVTVTLSGTEDHTAMTDASGQYAISGLAAGDYTVTISGYDAVEYSFTDSQDVTLAMDATAIVNFDGMSLRTAAVAVMVTADGEGVAGASASLVMVTGATSGTVAGAGVTGDDGGYTFGNLLAGAYRVDISVDSDEIEFADGTSWTGQVATGMTAEATFAGTVNRSAMISGMVTVDGAGMAGVMVTLSGGADDSMETGDDGSYSFSGLRKGDYTVSITNPDENRYEFGSTTESVNLAVGQSQSVSFAGSMTRSSSISGRVGLDDGTGVEGVTVTLSGAADDEATTDAGGLYTFTGLGAGDYTVAITLSDEAAAAYDFAEEETSKSVTLGDDDQETVNFEGSHKMSASVSGMLFVDEATKNDSYDDGEHPLPAPGVPVVLVGPEVDRRVPGVTDETGAFMFSDLRAGTYQLVVAITPAVAMALGDYAYGGSATGYTIDLGVGEMHTENLPFDITHQTVNFSVWMKHGDETGPALPGATVTFYADVAGKDMIESGETGDDGHTSIRFARPEMGNTVYAGITAPEGPYEVGGEMQAVMWDPKYPMMAEVVTNTDDVVNLKADVTFSGKTITTEAGGGDYLAEWAINVTMMDEDGEMVAVEGDDVPEMLGEEDADDEGMAAFMSMAESADDLGMTYYFGIVADEDQANSRDGGQMFEVTPMPSDYGMADGAMLAYEHDGLSLAGTMDLGSLEVKYTTQQLVVWVHQEKDQVAGYTKTISGGDSRPRARVETMAGHAQRWRDTGIFLELRQIDENGRSRPIPDYENRVQHPVYSSNPSRDGRTIFDKVPTDLNIVVKASTDAERRIINLDEAQAWRDFEANKVIGSAFGEHGGFHHTVNLCPETADDPDQDYLTACSTFGYVWTRDISGDAWSRTVVMAENPLDGHVFDTTYHSSIQVSLNPVARKNVQADNFGATSSAEQNAAGRQLGTYGISNVGDGDYTLSATGGWTVRYGSTYLRYTADESATGITPPAAQTIDIVPNSVYVYGTVEDEDGIGVQDVEVTVGSQTAITDDYGRYILTDVGHVVWTYFHVSKAGYAVTGRTDHAIRNNYSHRLNLRDLHLNDPDGRNTPQELDFGLRSVTPTGTVSGTIKHLQSDEPLEGVRVFALNLDAAPPPDLSVPGLVQVDTDADDMPVYTFGGVEFADVDTTDAEGMFSVDAPAGALNGKTTTIVAYRSGMFFMPDRHITTVVDGGAYSISFDGLRLSAIDGYIVDDDGVGVGDVTVTAVGGTSSTGVTRTAETSASGRYNIRVPWGPYNVTPDKDGYTFEPAVLSVTLAAEDIRTLQNFEASGGDDVTAPKVTLVRTPATILEDGGVSTVTATLSKAHTAAVTVTVSTTSTDIDGHMVSSNKVLTIPATTTSSTGLVTITAMNDEDTDNETVTISGDVTTPATGVTDPEAVELTITDDDVSVGAVTLELTPMSIEESGTNNMSTVTASLAVPAPVSFIVTVTAVPGMGDDFDLSSMTLIFAEGEMESAGVVTITAINNNTYDGDKTVTVSGDASSGRVDNPMDVTLTIMDDDVPPPQVSVNLSSSSIAEGAEDDDMTADVDESRVTVTATLDRAHTALVTVTVAAEPTTEATVVDDFRLTGQTLTIAIGATESTEVVTIEPLDDEDTVDESVTVSATADDNSDGDNDPATAPGVQKPADKTISITDDDAVPSAPTLTAADGTSQVVLTWTFPDDQGMSDGADGAVTGYEYRFKVATAEFVEADTWTSATNDANTLRLVLTTAAINGLVDGTAYKFQVRAMSSVGESMGSNVATATPAAP